MGFAATQWKLFSKESPPRVKPLLYVYRVLLTGIHLMRSGEVEANLVRLNESAKLSFIDDLVRLKLEGPEKGRLTEADLTLHESEYQRLVVELEGSYNRSTLPEVPSTRAALNDLLIRVRLSSIE
jgi:predicted nucleotidyltransferase